MTIGNTHYCLAVEKLLYLSLLSVGLLVAASGTLLAQLNPSRAPLPVFAADDVSGIFFEDVFTHLEGDRPPTRVGRETAAVNGPVMTSGKAGEVSTQRWSNLIAADTIADEVKSIKIRIEQQIRTPSDLAGQRAQETQRDFAMLAMLFAIVQEYEGEVRFRESGAIARDRFAAATAHLLDLESTGTAAAFKHVQAGKQDLQELLAGSNLVATTQPTVGWRTLSDRERLMQRLELGLRERLVVWTRDLKSVESHSQQILHEAEIARVVATVLTQPGAADSDDDEYLKLARQMAASAEAMTVGIRAGEPEQTRQAIDHLQRSCTECHELYR